MVSGNQVPNPPTLLDMPDFDVDWEFDQDQPTSKKAPNSAATDTFDKLLKDCFGDVSSDSETSSDCPSTQTRSSFETTQVIIELMTNISRISLANNEINLDAHQASLKEALRALNLVSCCFGNKFTL